MSISAERVGRLAELAVHVTPGRDAGRMVDGVDLVIDGEPAGRRPPRWIRDLLSLGYNPLTDGALTYVVLVDDEPHHVRDDVREALYEALAAIGAGHLPKRLRVEARTSKGLSVQIVSDFRIIGMAIGALQDDPITVIEGPSWLPAYPPGEEPRKKRSRRRPVAAG
jgi:hypothetical protein